MTDNSCEPSPNTGTTPRRASWKILRVPRSHSPYTTGGRTIVHASGVARQQPDLGAPAQPFRQRATPHQRGDGIATGTQRLDQVGTDEAGASGHKDVHSGLS